MKISNQIRRSADHNSEVKKVNNATCSNGWIIGYLYENSDKDIFQKDIEQNFSLASSTVSSVLTLMEEKELIKRESVPYDARLRKLVLTEKALNIQKTVIDGSIKLERIMLENFTEDEKKILFCLLEKIHNNLKKTKEQTEKEENI